ncbi:MAG: FCD domain-containing protein [Caulobacteraceae bacterium]
MASKTIPSIAKLWSPELEALGPPIYGPTGQAAFWLQRDIVRGVFEPGERLTVDSLTRFYGIGHSPIREAILTLSSSDLVAHEHLKGYRVTPTSVADYRDVLDAHQSIYRLVMAKALEHGDDAWEERVVVMLHRTLKVRKVLPDGAPEARERWQLAYKALHRELLSGAKSPVLQNIFAGLSNRLERYVNLYAEFESDRGRDHHAEHRVIVDALIARDRDQIHQLIDNYFASAQPIRESVLERLGTGSVAPQTEGAPRRRLARTKPRHVAGRRAA